MIQVTPEAADKLRELRGDDPTRAYLRLYVAGRSCCGYQYALAFDATADEKDAVLEEAGIPVAIDPTSAPYCEGAKIEWVDDETAGSGFLVTNPSVRGSCACQG